MDYPRWNQPPIDLCCFVSRVVDLCWRFSPPGVPMSVGWWRGSCWKVSPMFGDAIKAGRPYHSFLCSPGAVQKDGTCLSYASSALQGTSGYRKATTNHQNPQMKRIPPQTIGESLCSFRIMLNFFRYDMIFYISQVLFRTPQRPTPSKPFHIQGDMDLVLAAVQQEGMALEYASPELQVRNSICSKFRR